MADEPVKVVLPKATFDRVCYILSARGHADLVRMLKDEVQEEKGVERGAPKHRSSKLRNRDWNHVLLHT